MENQQQSAPHVPSESQSIIQEPKHLSKNILVIALIAFLIVIGGFYFLSKDQSQENIRPEAVTATSTKSNIGYDGDGGGYAGVSQRLTDYPPLFQSLSWKSESPTRTELSITVSEPFQYKTIPVNVNSRWTSREENLDEGNKYTNYQALSMYYESELKKRGWTWSVKIDNKEVHGPSADGPYGSVGSYVKIADNYLYSIIYRKSLIHAGYKDFPDRVSEPYCPCSSRYEVMFGEPVPLETFTKSSVYSIDGEVVTFVSGGTFPADGLWHTSDYEGEKLKIDYSTAKYSESYMSDGERVFVSAKEQNYDNFSEIVEIMKRPYDGPGGFRLLVTGPTDAQGVLHATRIILHRE